MVLCLPYSYCGGLESLICHLRGDLECGGLYVVGCSSVLEFFQMLKTIVGGNISVDEIK